MGCPSKIAIICVNLPGPTMHVENTGQGEFTLNEQQLEQVHTCIHDSDPTLFCKFLGKMAETATYSRKTTKKSLIRDIHTQISEIESKLLHFLKVKMTKELSFPNLYFRVFP